MKKKLLFLMTILSANAIAIAQTNPAITSWMLNTNAQKGVYKKYNNPNTGGATTTVTLTDSVDITVIAYSSSNVYVKTKDLADYTMGPWMTNPNVPSAQSLTFQFTLNPTKNTGTLMNVPGGGAIGLAVNGVLLYGFRDADSYSSTSNSNVSNGDGHWHTDAWYNEGGSMDATGDGHPDGNGNYHYHANPTTLYTDPSTSHSPIIGFALDGYPIYGPFGYSSAMDNSSGVKRMTSSYQLRSITQRTILPDGSTSSPAGPNVSASFPLGMYCEDYEYVSGLGDLDSLNGRYCVTPEYPSGTYAYFLSTKSSSNTGDPFYPYILGPCYYGTVSGSALANKGNSTIPSTGVTYVTATGITSSVSPEEISIFPNPTTDKINIDIKEGKYVSISIADIKGKVVSTYSLNSDQSTISLENLDKGVYTMTLTDEKGNSKVVRVVRQ